MNIILVRVLKGRYGLSGGRENDYILIVSSKRKDRPRRTKKEFIIGERLDIILNLISFGTSLVIIMGK